MVQVLSVNAAQKETRKATEMEKMSLAVLLPLRTIHSAWQKQKTGKKRSLEELALWYQYQPIVLLKMNLKKRKRKAAKETEMGIKTEKEKEKKMKKKNNVKSEVALMIYLE